MRGRIRADAIAVVQFTQHQKPAEPALDMITLTVSHALFGPGEPDPYFATHDENSRVNRRSTISSRSGLSVPDAIADA